MMRAAHYLLDADPKILADPFARSFVGFSDDQVFLKELRKLYGGAFDRLEFPKQRTYFVLRSRYTEDELEAAVARGVRNYVMLGAGLDSFAFRRPDLMRVLNVYEVDHPSTQTWKRERLAELSLKVPATLHFVPVDFERETLTEGLAAGGLQPDSFAFFSWLGVNTYLTPDAVLHTLREIAGTTGAGSELVTDYIVPATMLDGADRALFDSHATRVAELGEPWLSFFRPDELEMHLQQIGFGQVSHFGPAEACARYFAGRSDGPFLTGLCRMFRLLKARIL
jgi:methyltransferase (TIGR00027 family)